MKETYYFSHDYHSRNDGKLVKILMQKGLAGIGLFWCIVEMLFEEDGYLMLSECERIAFELRTTKEEVETMVNSSGLFCKDKEKFWSTSVLDRIGKRKERSEKAIQSANARWNKNANALRTHCEGNAINEMKGNEITTNTFVAFEKATLQNWNSFCLKYPILSAIKDITPSRRLKLKKRFEQNGFKEFESILQAISEQPFCLAENEHKWKISFDWLIENDTNYIKVLERKYLNKTEFKRKNIA